MGGVSVTFLVVATKHLAWLYGNRTIDLANPEGYNELVRGLAAAEAAWKAMPLASPAPKEPPDVHEGQESLAK